MSHQYTMWPVHSDKNTQYRVVRMEDNIVKYERIFNSKEEAQAYIKNHESI